MSDIIRSGRRVRLLVRMLTAALSLAVLTVTAIGWIHLRQLDQSTPTAAVIDGPPAAPAAEQNILLVGLDSRTDAMGNPLPAGLLAALHAGEESSGGDTADSLVVIHIPAGGGRASAISIPRDAYVDLGQDLGRHKINSAYARASEAATARLTGGSGGTTLLSSRGAGRPSPNDPAVARAAAAAGARATIASVEQLTGLRISHYAAVSLAGFADVSAAIGGVAVCLRAPTRDPYSGLALPAGVQEVSGPRALAFVRQRHGLPNGDLDRIARQQVFLAGATDRLLSAGTLTDPVALRRLTGVASRAITLDAGWDLLAFARQMQGLSAGAVTFRTVPTGSTTLQTEDGSAVQVDPREVRAFVAGVVTKAAAPPPSAPPPSPPSASASGAVSGAAADRPTPPTTTTRPTPSRAMAADGGDDTDRATDGTIDDTADGASGAADGEGVADAGTDTSTTTAPSSPGPSAGAPAPITAATPGCVN